MIYTYTYFITKLLSFAKKMVSCTVTYKQFPGFKFQWLMLVLCCATYVYAKKTAKSKKYIHISCFWGSRSLSCSLCRCCQLSFSAFLKFHGASNAVDNAVENAQGRLGRGDEKRFLMGFMNWLTPVTSASFWKSCTKQPNVFCGATLRMFLRQIFNPQCA